MPIVCLPDADVPCELCGLDYARGNPEDQQYHRAYHDRAINGRRTKLADGRHLVTHGSPMGLQKLAEWAAIEANRETQYDFASFHAKKQNVDEYNTKVIISVNKARVISLIVSRERDSEMRARLEDFDDDKFTGWQPTKAQAVPPTKRRTVDMIWVLKTHRRQGEARALIQALADAFHLQVGI